MNVLRRYSLYGAGLIAALVVMLIMHTTPAAAYDNSIAGGQAYDAAWCAGQARYNYNAVADFLWPSATDGSATLVVYSGDTTVDIRINVTVLYCSGYNGTSAGSTYHVSPGGIVGFFNYGNNGANNTWNDSQIQTLNITGWGAGIHEVCVFADTWMKPRSVYSEETPRQCTYFNLVIKSRWNINGQSYVRNVTTGGANVNGGMIRALPGDTVAWSHDMRNVGPDNMDEWVQYNTDKRGYSGGDAWLNGNPQPTGWGQGAVNELFVKLYPPDRDGRLQKVITQDDVGAGLGGRDPICQRVAWYRGAYNYDGWLASNWACVQVPYKFNLTPTVNAPTDTTEPGAPIGPISPNVNNSGPTKSYDGTGWQLSKFIVPPGGSIPGAADTASDPCGYYRNGCAKLSSGNQTFMPGDTMVGQLASYTVDDAPMGARLCFALSVTGYDQDHTPSPNAWRNGVPSCVMIGKKPKVQVWGGDVAARGGINVSLTQKTIGVFGSWVEYGAFSVGSNDRFASGAGLTPQPTPKGSPVQNDWSKLTFANVDTTGNPHFGQYSAAAGFRPQPNIAQYFAAVSNTAPFQGNKPGAAPNTFATGGPIQVMTAGDLTLQGDTIPAGRSGVIIASGDVTITGDITYDSKAPRNSLTELSQLVIIAKNIHIASNVGTVDAWLVTSDMHNGVVDTCSDYAPPLTGTICNTTLTIHGPVVAGELHLKRTAGSGTGPVDSGAPAEVIDLRPDAYLWAQLIAGSAGKAETVYTTELPPRF